jgi:FkbM family methyltransferase
MLIFDLGMHRGEDTEFYLNKGFSVVAVEADPDLAGRNAQRLAEYVRSGHLTIINKAIVEKSGPVTFYRCKNVSDWGTIARTWAQRNAQMGGEVVEITVDGVTIDEILAQYGAPYYMKIDIEGADIVCLRGLGLSGIRPKFVSIESSKTSFDEIVEEFGLFLHLGYDMFKIVPQHKVHEQVLPNPAREGMYIDHRFKRGSSGSFGLELPGQWLTLEQSIAAYLRIMKLYRLTGDYGKLSGASPIRTALNKSRISPNSLGGRIVRNIVRPVSERLGLRPGWYDTHAMHSGRMPPDEFHS